MEAKQEIHITAEITPNPNTLKFITDRVFIESGSLNFPDREKAKGSLLPETLFKIENVLGVMAGRDFVTVTKMPQASWNAMAEPIIHSIRSLLSSNQPLFSSSSQTAPAVEGHTAGNSDIEMRIRHILDSEIRPAVAMDGGDILFYGYENGVVTLHLQGSCSSCPSSVMTLKMGVENRLKSLIPEVREVVQV